MDSFYCNVCLNSLAPAETALALPCAHIVCRGCADTSLSSSCPVCKQVHHCSCIFFSSTSVSAKLTLVYCRYYIIKTKAAVVIIGYPSCQNLPRHRRRRQPSPSHRRKHRLVPCRQSPPKSVGCRLHLHPILPPPS